MCVHAYTHATHATHTATHTTNTTTKHPQTFETHLAQKVEPTTRGDAGSIPAVGIDFIKKKFVLLF